jgi:hypothetical protein
MFFACTGVIIKNDPETKMRSFLTSLSLVRSTEDDSKIFHNMTVGTAKLVFFCCSISIACFLTCVLVVWLFFFLRKHPQIY